MTDEEKKQLFKSLRKAGRHPGALPSCLKGLAECAKIAEECEIEHSRLFWNTKRRPEIPDDTRYVAFVINILKERGGLHAVQSAMRIIHELEARNA